MTSPFVVSSTGYCAFVDAEHALDPSFAEAIGVDTQNLMISQPDCGEQALSLVDTLIRSGSVDVVVVDSVSKMLWFLRKCYGQELIVSIFLSVVLWIHLVGSCSGPQR